MKQIKGHREVRRWSKAELARRAGLNASTVGWIESGRFRPYPGQLEKLAHALGVPSTDLSEAAQEADGPNGTRD